MKLDQKFYEIYGYWPNDDERAWFVRNYQSRRGGNKTGIRIVLFLVLIAVFIWGVVIPILGNLDIAKTILSVPTTQAQIIVLPSHAIPTFGITPSPVSQQQSSEGRLPTPIFLTPTLPPAPPTATLSPSPILPTLVPGEKPNHKGVKN